MLKLTLLLLFTVTSILASAQLNGSYTIGGASPSYVTISDAVNDLIGQGVSGPVVFNIRSGNYLEQVTIPFITGVSQTNQITFQSENLDSLSVTWRYNSANLPENFVCILDGAQFINIKYMTIARDDNGSAGCRNVIFQNGAHNNSLSHCRLLGKSVTSSTDHEVVYSTNTIDTNNYIGYNYISNGRYSIYFQGTNNTTCEPGTIIEYNRMAGGIYSVNYTYSDNLIFHNNNADASIDLTYFDGKLRFSNNYVTRSVDIHYHQTAVNDSVLVYGNMIITPYQSSGLYLRDCPNAIVYHNSFYGNMPSNVSTSGILRINNTNARVANNIIHNTNGGFIVFLEYSSTIVSDYNIFYSLYRFIKKNGTIYADLASWQAGTLQDMSSFFTTTNFTSPTDLHIVSDPYANGNGFNLGVIPDMDGDVRPSNPDIGADEFINPPNDAGVSFMADMNGYMCAGDQPIYVNVTNFGSADLNSVTIGWSVNGVVQTPFYWTGSALPNDTITNIFLGNYTFSQYGTYDIEAWTYDPNGVTDAISYNDTIYPPTIYTMLEGAYTVGGVSPDFPTLNACFQALIDRGLCGPVTFNIRTGDYNEWIDYDLDVVEGLSWVNTVTFQSEALSPDSVTQWWTANTFSQNWILQGNYWSHIYFKHITFTRTNTGNGNEIAVFNNAYDLKFIDCIFNENAYIGGGALRVNSGSIITVDSCQFNRMSDAVWCEIDSNFIVTNSVFDNIRSTSIYIHSCLDSTIIRNNTIFNDTMNVSPNSSLTGTGISVAYCDNTVEVDKNQIAGRFTQGIIMTCVYDSLKPAIVTNNCVSTQATNFNGSFGIQVNGGYNTIFKHNSIRIEDPDWDQPTPNYFAGFGIGSNTHKNFTFVNNLLEIEGSGLAFKLGLDWQNLFIEFDHNNVYLVEPTLSSFVNAAPAWPDVWNANTGYVNPIYYSNTDLHVINPQLALGIATWASVLDDVDSDLREHPTVGADEGEFIPINTGGILLDVVNQCDSAKIYVKVFNYGLDTIFNFDVEHAIDGANMSPLTWVGTLDPGDTTDWIYLSTFLQIDQQNYVINANTKLPNNIVDLDSDNDTVEMNYVGANPELDLGDTLSICFPDSAMLTYFPNSNYGNLMWSTGETTDTLFVQTGGVYYLNALNEFGCPKEDSVVVIAGGFQLPMLSTDSVYIYSNEAYGTNSWYYNDVLIPGISIDSLLIVDAGNYYLVNTDTLGCTANSDTITIENYRDAGAIMLYLTHTCDSSFVSVDVKNYSVADLNAVDVSLILDGILVNTISWTGLVAAGDTIFNVNLGGFPTTYGLNQNIGVYTSNPNGLNDFDIYNDSVFVDQLLTQPVLDLGDDIIICNGDKATLIITDSLDYSSILWSTNETTGTVILEEAGEYWVEAVDSFGCMHYDTLVLIVGGQSVPTVTSVDNILYASESMNIQWYLDGAIIPGETADSLVATHDGDYFFSYVDEYGCVTYSDTISLFLGINEHANEEINLFPNPAQSFLTIRTQTNTSEELFITDLQGNKVSEWRIVKVSGNETIVDISQLAMGTYICQVEDLVRRFVIIR